MSETTTLLPGEGETRTQVRVRERCLLCEALATVRIGFLLHDFRSNPASAGYRRDDCTRVNDAIEFACEAHERYVEQAHDEMTASAWWRLTDKNAHLFLTWEVRS